MNLFTIAYKSIRQRWVASTLTSISVALGIALMIAVMILNGVITRIFNQSGSGYDLVVGPKGSDLQLVLSTIYHIENPIENLPWRFYKELAANPTVERAIPVNIGDTTEVGNFPIVGTTPQYLLVDYVPGKQFQIKGDGLRGTWDSVIGSQVARQNKWTIGSKFKMVHAGDDGHVHDEEFTVKGILAPTGTPNDRTVLVHIDGFFAISGHDNPVEQAIAREALFYGQSEDEIKEFYKDDLIEIAKHAHHDHSGHDHAHDHHHGPTSDLQKEVTSVLLVMKGEGFRSANAAMALQNKLKQGFQAQAANTVSVMQRVMTNLVGNVRDAFLYLTGLIIVVSGIGIFVSIYNSMADRKKEIAVMRALGARRATVLSIILVESILLCVLGGILGIILGHGLVYLASPIIEARSGLLIDPVAFDPWELAVIPGLIAMASLIGLIPGLTAYRTDVAESLQS
ncbi:ABC transporter permease [Planctomicrobium sp. SH668]|uniref:ABC transporter permease n=1 Tax=Planctomicrobium sp. SH668 TaxID=3448126 RepID=UPI003F5B7E25